MLDQISAKFATGQIIDDTVEKVIAGLIGAVVIIVIERLWALIVENNSPFSGKWRASIFDETGSLTKTDKWRIRQRGDILKGEIERIHPMPTRKAPQKKWVFNGRLRGKDFFAIYYAKTQSNPSYGALHLRQVEEDKFEGFYLKLQQNSSPGSETFTENLNKVRIALEKDHD